MGILFGAVAVYALTPSLSLTISGGIYPRAAYTVWKEGATFYAKNKFGAIVCWGTNKTEIIENCVTAIGSDNATILLDSDVSLNPYDLDFDNNIVIEYENGVSIYEEWFYKTLVAITSPSLQHVQVGEFQFTPTDTIYSYWKTIVRYEGMLNYIDNHLSGSFDASLITQHTTAQGYLEGGSAATNLECIWYVNASDVETITNARALWFKRLQWLQTTEPTNRTYVEQIRPEDMGEHPSKYATFSVGTYGSIVKNFFFQGYEINLIFQHTGTWRNVWVNMGKSYVHVNQTSGTDIWGHGWINGEIMFAAKASVDGTPITYGIRVYGSEEPQFDAYGIFEVYDVPEWWDDF